MNFGELLTNNREKIISTCGKYGAQNVRVFGSVARGEANDKSDIDLLIKPKKGFSLLDLVRLENELSSVLKHKVDVITEGALTRPQFRQNVLKDARLV